jgi:hypothetical protein
LSRARFLCNVYPKADAVERVRHFLDGE